jgi:hypothetical protein
MPRALVRVPRFTIRHPEFAHSATLDRRMQPSGAKGLRRRMGAPDNHCGIKQQTLEWAVESSHPGGGAWGFGVRGLVRFGARGWDLRMTQ